MNPDTAIPGVVAAVLVAVAILIILVFAGVIKVKKSTKSGDYGKEGYEGPNYGWFSSDYLYGAAGTVPPCGDPRRPSCALAAV